MQYIVVDLEATCWPTGTYPARQEIIEIGAVRLQPPLFQPSDQFSRFVRPVAEPILSDFCCELTHIRQQDIDQADEFPVVLREFVDWIGSQAMIWCSWGAYDLKQLRVDCQRHHLTLPAMFEQHLNIKQAFARLKQIRPGGMKAALAIEGLALIGQHHRAIDDARNIARIAQSILPQLAASP
jgi:3'-5' exoribonuclease 1